MRAAFLALFVALASRTAVAQQRDVRIAGSDAYPLEATYFDPGKPGPGILFFRNCDQKRQEADTFARKLSDQGFHVVSYDYRNGLIAGKDWNSTRADDARSIRSWLLANTSADTARLGVIGGSCGVQVALQFAMAFAPQVKAVVILSGPHSDEQRAFIARTPGLALLAVASDGEGSEQYMKPIAEASRHPNSRLIVLRGRAHGMNMLVEYTGLEPDALRWLIEVLGPLR